MYLFRKLISFFFVCVCVCVCVCVPKNVLRNCAQDLFLYSKYLKHSFSKKRTTKNVYHLTFFYLKTKNISDISIYLFSYFQH